MNNHGVIPARAGGPAASKSYQRSDPRHAVAVQEDDMPVMCG